VRTVVLLSGGPASLVCAERARVEGRLAGCVFVDYGHPGLVADGWRAFAYAGAHRVPLVAPHVRDLAFDGSCEHNFTARSAIMLSVAANAAQQMGARTLTLGTRHPAGASVFIGAMMVALGLPIETPLMDWSPAAIRDEALRLGLTREIP
jgi:7-cyano-7-deazaguanine synthase in queuosine biosynthesis